MALYCKPLAVVFTPGCLAFSARNFSPASLDMGSPVQIVGKRKQAG
jgi:hypothetical protein